MSRKVREEYVCDVCGRSAKEGSGRGYDYCESCRGMLQETTVTLLGRGNSDNSRAVASLLRQEAARIAPPKPRRKREEEKTR